MTLAPSKRRCIIVFTALFDNTLHYSFELCIIKLLSVCVFHHEGSNPSLNQ